MEIINFVIAIFLGALIGLQREWDQEQTKISRFAGIRTFILISILGSITSYTSLKIFNNSFLFITGFVIISILAIASYLFKLHELKNTKAITETSAIIVYLLSGMCIFGLINEAVILGVIVSVILTFKSKIHLFAHHIKKDEIFAVVEFALISLVILPLLPNQAYSPIDIPILKEILVALGLGLNTLEQLRIFNFYKFWLMVILVAGISFLGYILVKVIGSKKGYGLTGFVGGLVSSTAVTLSMSENSLNKKDINPYVIATIVATGTSFIRVLFATFVINNNLAKAVWLPLIAMGLTSYLSAYILSNQKNSSITNKKPKQEIEYKQPFNIITAIKFGSFFIFIIFVAKLAQIIAGANGIYFASILSGLADVDAITLSMASLSKTGEVMINVATLAIILAVSSNTIVKASMTYVLGNKEYSKKIILISAITLSLGLITVFLY